MAQLDLTKHWQPSSKHEKGYRVMDRVCDRAKEIALTGDITVRLVFNGGGLVAAASTLEQEKILT